MKDRAEGYVDSRGKRAPIVIFEKEIDGSHVVVEAVCDTKRNRNYISEYIAKNGVDQAKTKKALQSPMDAVADPRDNVRNVAADTLMEEAAHTSSDLNIAEDGETVNEESKKRAESAQEMRETEDGERKRCGTDGSLLVMDEDGQTKQKQGSTVSVLQTEVSENRPGVPANIRIAETAWNVNDLKEKLREVGEGQRRGTATAQ